MELISSRVVPAVSDLVADGLRINFSFGLADDLLERLASGHYDLVLSTVRPRLRGISAVTLVDEEFAILASPELASGIPTGRIMKEGPAAVLDKYPLIAYAESLPIIRRYWLTVFGIRPTSAPSLVIPDLRGVLAAVKSSAGISVLPTYLAADALLRGEAVKLLEPEIPPINTFYLATRDGGMCHPDLTLLHSHLLMRPGCGCDRRADTIAARRGVERPQRARVHRGTADEAERKRPGLPAGRCETAGAR